MFAHSKAMKMLSNVACWFSFQSIFPTRIERGIDETTFPLISRKTYPKLRAPVKFGSQGRKKKRPTFVTFPQIFIACQGSGKFSNFRHHAEKILEFTFDFQNRLSIFLEILAKF